MIELAVKAGRKRQSLQTGFVHYCYEDGESRETIPILENFCFALALFRTHIAASVLEGKALVEKLLAFQVGDNFPVYLHEYPVCRNPQLGMEVYPILYWIEQEFKYLKLESVLAKLPQPKVKVPHTPEQWAELLMVSQLQNLPMPEVSYKNYAFLGPQRQEKFEPAVTLLDLYMGELFGTYSKRALQDHPIHLKAALVRPIEEKRVLPTDPFVVLPQGLVWGDQNHTHSLVVDVQGEYQDGVVHLSGEHEPDEMEVAIYCDAHPDNGILVNGRKSTTFQLGDTLTIGKSIKVRMERMGEGDFFGHIHFGNRPGQIAPTRFEAYDWKIGLRTIRRPTASSIRLYIEPSGSL